MTPIVSWLLLLASQVAAIDLEVYDTSSVHGSFDDVETFVREEMQVVNSLIVLDIQLDHVLDHVASSSSSTDIEVVIEVPEDVGNGSGLETLDEIVVVVPAGAKLSDEEKDEIQHEIETEVAETLDARIVETAMQSSEEEGGVSKVLDKATRLFEEEAEAEQELQQMEGQLKTVLDNLSSSADTEIDIVVTESDDDKQQEKELVVVIPAESRHRLTEQEKQELEDEIVDEAADALGEVILNEFLKEDAAVTTMVNPLEEDLRLEEASPQENTFIQHTSAPQKIADDVDVQSYPKPAFRGTVATAIAQPGFEHPMFVPHHWQMPPDEQLWTIKLSMLTSISCMTLLLIVGVWTGVRRSRRRAVMDDNQFRWAEAVEYMDAFPYDH